MTQADDDIRSDFELLMAEKSLPIERDMLGDYYASCVHAAFKGFEAACANPPKCVRDRIIYEFLNTPQTSGHLSSDIESIVSLNFERL